MSSEIKDRYVKAFDEDVAQLRVALLLGPRRGPLPGRRTGAFAFYATRFVFIGADAYPEWSLPAAQTPIFGSWSM